MIHHVFIAAAADATTEGGAAIDLQTVLLLAIVICLAFMAKALADLGRRVRALAPARPSAAPSALNASTSREIVRTSAVGELPPELVAVITAAVCAVSDDPVRIVAVDEAKNIHSGTWSLEGRRQIFSSHRVR